jgi:hypothetical protein
MQRDDDKRVENPPIYLNPEIRENYQLSSKSSNISILLKCIPTLMFLFVLCLQNLL